MPACGSGPKRLPGEPVRRGCLNATMALATEFATGHGIHIRPTGHGIHGIKEPTRLMISVDFKQRCIPSARPGPPQIYNSVSKSRTACLTSLPS